MIVGNYECTKITVHEVSHIYVNSGHI